MNNYRLRTGKLFNREEEKDKEPPKRIVFLSVEGNVTECHYFKWLDKHKNEIGINSIVYVHVLSRGRNDTRSAPADVIELLEEYMTIRSGDISICHLPGILPAFMTMSSTTGGLKPLCL